MILTIIPARGGSKGIPKKNSRNMNGQPLIEYSVQNAIFLKKFFDMDIAITTDDYEIMQIVKRHDEVILIERPSELCDDMVPLAPVIYHAVSHMEKMCKKKYDIVLTMQPTSPTIKYQSIKQAIDEFINGGYDTMLSVHNKPHLSWSKNNDKIVPTFEKRLNRQLLPAHYEETGGFLISKRECVTQTNRIGDNVGVYELSDKESIDIDTNLDWVLCESILKSKKILFRVDGEENLGMGHIYRCLSLAYHFTQHEILFVLKKSMNLGINKIKNSYFNYKIIDDDKDLVQIIEEYNPDIIINDILNTKLDYMKMIKRDNIRVINFEDKGEGASEADVVINALYMGKVVNANEYRGTDYFFIRDEFLEVCPKKFDDKVKNIVIIFGGSDPGNYTKKVYDVVNKLSQQYNDISYNFITGFGYKYKNELKSIPEKNIYIYNDVQRVSSFLAEADLAITSQGRTIYELACMGVPSIVLAQNLRELNHTFASMQNGYINLGLGDTVEGDTIYNTMKWLIDMPAIRKEMHKSMLQYDFSLGQRRVIRLILDE